MIPTSELSIDLADFLKRDRYGSLVSNEIKDFDGDGLIERDYWSSLHMPDISQASETQIAAAIDIAQEAFLNGSWRNFSKFKRRTILLSWANLIETNAHYLASINCLETGRSLGSLLRDSLPKAIQALRWFAELTDKIDDRAVRTGEFKTDFAIVLREPLGVIASILPWNDPMVTLIWKVAPALAVGNAVIVKPSEYCTLVIREALTLAHKAGVPISSLQMLCGDGRVGKSLVQNKGVQKIAFTGSTETAISIAVNSHRHGLKRLSFECGGKGSFIFGEYGNRLEEFARVVARNIFYNQGQICSAPSVVHVPESLINQFSTLVGREAIKYLPSNPWSDAEVGIMISPIAVLETRKRLMELKDDCFFSKIFDKNSQPFYEKWSINPVVLRGLESNHPLWDQELFAPILLIRPYGSVDEAVEFSNASRYGLAAGIWSQDIDECMRISTELKVGNVHINSWGDDPNQVPFGGVKDSGYGREKSKDALDDYTELKSIFFRPVDRL